MYLIRICAVNGDYFRLFDDLDAAIDAVRARRDAYLWVKDRWSDTQLVCVLR